MIRDFRYNTVLGLVILALGLMLSSGCIKRIDKDSPTTATADSTAVTDPDESRVIVLDGAESQTVLGVLQAHNQVEMKTSAMGAFVVAIDSIRNGGDAYWLYSVNGEMGQVASDRFLTRPGDTVRWHFRIIDQ